MTLIEIGIIVKLMNYSEELIKCQFILGLVIFRYNE